MTGGITQAAIEATKAAVHVLAVTRDEAGSKHRNESVGTGSKLGGPTWKQPTFDWRATDKYMELRNFQARGKQQFPNI